jgi:hypothetical protein
VSNLLITTSKTKMSRSVTADDVVLFLAMTTIVGIMLAIEATDIVNNRVWVSDPVEYFYRYIRFR